MKKATIALLVICTAVFAQQKGTFTDTRDKKTYKTVKIGEQTWMAENLNYNAEGSRCNGEDGEVEAIIGYDKDDYFITKTKTLPSSKVQANCAKYGRLYDWATAMNIDAKFNETKWTGKDVKHNGVCPKGWHLPNDKEWKTLRSSVSGYGVVGDEVVQNELKATSGWEYMGKSGNGTDGYGFTALPGGMGGKWYNGFGGSGEKGFWWSSTSYDNGAHIYGLIHRNSSGNSINKSDLLSVRCVQD